VDGGKIIRNRRRTLLQLSYLILSEEKNWRNENASTIYSFMVRLAIEGRKMEYTLESSEAAVGKKIEGKTKN